MTHTYSSNLAQRVLLCATLFITLLALAIPTFSHAATYAFVNTSGEVSMVVANDPMTAIATAFNRAARSGVMLLTSQTDAIIGDHVSGS